jgi:hypothetical protein
MRLGSGLLLVLALAAIGACSRQPQTASCEPSDRYTTARSVAPVQIPDDLSPPDETDALRLPPVVPTPTEVATEACLEVPPAFFRAGRPGAAQASEDPKPGDSAEPPVQETPPADGGDRAIDN